MRRSDRHRRNHGHYDVACLVLIACAVVNGCSRAKDPWDRAEVSGHVLLDGQPLKSGRITFHPNGVPGTVAGGEIKDGFFLIKAINGPVIGSNRVEIRSVQKTGRVVPATVVPEGDAVMTEGQLIEEYLDLVPAEYNQNSKLIYELTKGENKIDIEMTSQSPDVKPTSLK